MGSGRGQYLVFVSHSSRDTWVAKQIVREIENCGAATFLDEIDIDAGADFEEEIRIALGKANELLVLVTPWALERPYVWVEISVAWIRSIPIVPLLQGITPSELQARPEIPLLLKERDAIELNKIDVYLNQLKKRIDETKG